MQGLGQGGTFDYEAGRIKRAPLFIQKIGMEWLWRLIREPKRIKRQLVLPVYLFKVIFAKDKTKGKFEQKYIKLAILRKQYINTHEESRSHKWATNRNRQNVFTHFVQFHWGMATVRAYLYTII